MALLGNIIWFVLGGWWNFLLYGFLGCVCCITIIGIPIGKALFQYAKLMVFPFGKVIVRETDIKGTENVAAVRRAGGMIANILWLPVGVISFLLNIGLIIACAVTIVGIPFAVVIAKSCTFLLWPIGARVITKQEEETLRMEKSMMKVMGTAMAVGGMSAQPSLSITENRQIAKGERTDSLQTDQMAEWAKRYSEYIAAAVGLLMIIISGVVFGAGIGILLAAPVMAASAVFAFLKQNHIVVCTVLGIEIVANLALCLMGGYTLVSLLLVVCFAGVTAYYILVYVDKTGNTKKKLLQQTAALKDRIGKIGKQQTPDRHINAAKTTVTKKDVNTVPAGKLFCGKCGATLAGQAKFCPKCGQSISR